ncbi:MAG TPA: TetR/AcrR family transcriptional regulator [Anaerolineaceae bacterium]|nr:TetR/AcrR family transcriptional regulator [Anaerolineaceae bacterium]
MEPAEKTDRRSVRSQRLLSDALVSLVLEKGYDEITNKDITDRADVAYVTFYRHYKDKDDLMNRIIQASLAGLIERIEQAARSAFGDGGDDQEGQLIFRHVQENADLYRILLSSMGASRVRKQVQDAVASVFRKNCPPTRSANPLIPGDVIAGHMATSLLGLVEWWLEHEMALPADHMSRIYHEMIIAASARLLVLDRSFP